MIRSLFAFAAAVWFGYNALWYVGAGVQLNDGADWGIDGEVGALAVTYAVRVLCFGFALASLAAVDWHWVLTVPREILEPPAPDGE